MGSHGFGITAVSAVFYLCILHHSTSSDTGGDTHFEVTQHPPEVTAKEGENVSFMCTIDKKYTVSRITIRKDRVNVMMKIIKGSDIIDQIKPENVFYSGAPHDFTISVLVRNKTDSNTYYCYATVQGHSSMEICGAGTFIKITDSGNVSLCGIMAGVSASLLVILLFLLFYCYIREK